MNNKASKKIKPQIYTDLTRILSAFICVHLWLMYDRIPHRQWKAGAGHIISPV